MSILDLFFGNKHLQLNEQGMALYNEGKYEKACKLFIEALDVMDSKGIYDYNYLLICFNILSAMPNYGNLSDISIYYEKALVVFSKGKFDDDLIDSFSEMTYDLGDIYRTENDFESAFLYYSRGVELYEKGIFKSFNYYIKCYFSKAYYYDSISDYNMVIKIYKNVLKIYQSNVDKVDSELMTIYSELNEPLRKLYNIDYIKYSELYMGFDNFRGILANNNKIISESIEVDLADGSSNSDYSDLKINRAKISKTDKPIDELWSKFCELVKEKSPLKYDLNKGVDENELNTIKSSIKKFPDNLSKLYKLNNGEDINNSDGIFFGLYFMDINDLLFEWNNWKDIVEDEETNEDISDGLEIVDDKKIKKTYANIKYIPFIKDGGGNFIGIDLDPAKGGKLGQIINFGSDEDRRFVIADSLEDFINLLIESIEKGMYKDKSGNGSQSFLFNGCGHFIDGLKKFNLYSEMNYNK